MPRLTTEQELDLLDEEISYAKDLSDAMYLRATQEDNKGRTEEFKTWAVLNQRWQGMHALRTDLTEKYERRSTEQVLARTWNARVEALRDDLLKQYASGGAQYVVLCTVVAPLVVKLEQSYAGGLHLTTSEQNALASTIMQLIAQLQRHTESTRTESLVYTKQVVTHVLNIVGRHLTAQPGMMNSILGEVRKALAEGSADTTATPVSEMLDI